MSEKVLGVIDGVKHGRPPRNWSLFVTSHRLVVATVGRTGLGATFEFGGILMAKSRAKRKTEKLLKASPDDVLIAHRKNYEIPYSQVSKAELDDPSVVASGALNIDTITDAYEFLLTNKDRYQEHADILKSALGEKITFR
ncbi:MAG: hypothetical protein GTO63_17480 [Anaerolineae bacterium]|nr:hypothetical protein [Anaerolineae bacterium]